MDGAIQSGWRSAKEILTKLGIKYEDPEEQHPKPTQIHHVDPSMYKDLLERLINFTKLP